MFSKIYFKFSHRKVSPIVGGLIILVGFILGSLSTIFSIVVVCSLIPLCAYKYGKIYWGQLKKIIIMGFLVGVMTLNINLFFAGFIKVMAFSHLAFLVFYLCPPTSFTHPVVKLTLAFMPYFERQIQNITYSARLKGLKINSRNPYRFFVDGMRFFTPMMFVLLRVIPSVEDSLKLKGYQYK